ncbi:hypothetical protein Lalb_Chr07g0179741 [Lupinus albus]|uniref:Uncharacterized protein n=1 Tax=Lupinus albus TaxID=3870 RepID=A0A6A4Q8D7_LUPAL|nr:hypothetical protein Lalb_Chr07g0179741 [Lupinus albus]
MVSECEKDGWVTVKHSSPVAWQLVAAIHGGVASRRPIPFLMLILSLAQNLLLSLVPCLE